MTTANPDPRCRKRRRVLAPWSMRPTDLLAAFFVSGIAFMLAGAVAGVLHAADVTGWYGRWLALHLVLLGGVSQLVLGAGQFFCTAFLATDPPSRKMVRAQLGSWAVGTICIAVGVPSGRDGLTDLGAAAILVGLALFALALWQLERRSLQRARWAVRWYYASAASLGLGALLGAAMARSVTWTHGSLLGAHLALNLGGWLGTAIVGTLHTFYPSLTSTLLRHPRLQGPTFIAWIAGVALLAAGYAFDSGAVLSAGWAALLVASALLAANVVASWRAGARPARLPARLVGVAQAFLVAGLLVALAVHLDEGTAEPLYGPWRGVVAALLVAGWVGLTVAGSLLHLLSVLHRVRRLATAMPAPSPGADILITAVAAGAVALLALSRVPGVDDGLRRPAAVALTAVALVLAARILRLAAGAVRSAGLRL